MKKLWREIIILFGTAALLLGGFCLAQGQIRTVRVYNPSIYNRTRTKMSNRAATKAALKKAQQKAALQKVKKKRRQAVVKRRRSSR